MKKFALIASMVLTLALVGVATAGAAAKDTLTVAWWADPMTLDPIGVDDTASSGVITAIHETLVGADDLTGELVPGLAEKWEQTGPAVYRFTLRKGVRFHNGEPFTAADVKYSIDRAIEKGSAVKTYTNAIAGVDVIDDFTVDIRLKSPFTPFLQSLTIPWGCIVNKKAVEAAGDSYGMQPVGTGPFVFKSWIKNDGVVMERFDDYWGEKPTYKTLVMRSIPEMNARAIELESGAVDISCNIGFNDVDRIKSNPDLKVASVFDYSLQFIGFNSLKPPFDDVRVRRAVYLATDTQEIREVVFHNSGKRPVSFLNPIIKYADTSKKPHEQNVEEAKKLLAEAGVKPGLKIELWTNDNQERIDIASILQAYLKKVDIDMEIKVTEHAALNAALKEGKHDLVVYASLVAANDPHYVAYRGFHSAMLGYLNRNYVKDERVDALIDRGSVTPEGPERAAVYKELQDLIDELAPWMYVQHNERTIGMQKNVKGFLPNAKSYYDWRKVSFE